MKAKKVQDEMLLELEGVVNIVEKKNGKVVSREPLEGEVVLKCLLHFITEACERTINDAQFREDLKKSAKARKR